MKNSFNELTLNELLAKKEELTKKYRDIRFSRVVSNVSNPLEARVVRRQIARLNTLIHKFKLAGKA